MITHAKEKWSRPLRAGDGARDGLFRPNDRLRCRVEAVRLVLALLACLEDRFDGWDRWWRGSVGLLGRIRCFDENGGGGESVGGLESVNLAWIDDVRAGTEERRHPFVAACRIVRGLEETFEAEVEALGIVDSVPPVSPTVSPDAQPDTLAREEEIAPPTEAGQVSELKPAPNWIVFARAHKQWNFAATNGWLSQTELRWCCVQGRVFSEA